MVNQFGGDWIRAKLEILRGYLNPYTTALKKQSFHLCYVDAFAGTGYVVAGTEDEGSNLLKGSARIAIEVDDKPFDKFLFIEQRFEYAAELSKLRYEFPDRDIQIYPGDANQVIQDWCLSQNHTLGTPWRGQRAVIFLDPFATEVDWQTVQLISETKSVDLWILFPLSALTRMMPSDKEPDEANIAGLNRVFGSQEWREELYRPSSQAALPLVGDEQLQSVRAEQQAIVDLYLRKLKEIFAEVSPNPKWLRNSRNSPLFAFMFASANPRGGKIAVDIANHLLNHW